MGVTADATQHQHSCNMDEILVAAAADTSRRAGHASTDDLAMDGGEVAQATCKEQPFDVGFHPTSGVFVAGLITGEVRHASPVAPPPTRGAEEKTLGAVPPTPRA
jgi:hypothetical protein